MHRSRLLGRLHRQVASPPRSPLPFSAPLPTWSTPSTESSPALSHVLTFYSLHTCLLALPDHDHFLESVTDQSLAPRWDRRQRAKTCHAVGPAQASPRRP